MQARFTKGRSRQNPWRCAAHIVWKLSLLVLPMNSFAQDAAPQASLLQDESSADELNAVSPAGCTFQALNVPNGFVSSASGVNNIGAIVGNFAGGPRNQDRSFLLFRGKFTFFIFPGSIATDAFDINNQAQIVGSYSDGRQVHGFLAHSGGFETVDVPVANTGAFATGINDSGDIVGFFFTSSNLGISFLRHGGHFTFFSFPGSDGTQAASINDNSIIVGTYFQGQTNHGFMVRNGAFATIDFPGAVSTSASKVNKAGVVVGTYLSQDRAQHGFAFSISSGKFTSIDVPNTTGTSIVGINDQNEIVGGFSTPASFNSLAFRGTCSAIF
ncbi:MAG TPA: hypothetical protein VKZ53_23680 [Candidatus Angelobacter sp.]|nr:hypothetical protein [Candidatus Angelobacter sp.]